VGLSSHEGNAGAAKTAPVCFSCITLERFVAWLGYGDGVDGARTGIWLN
jgi:hypothetical protein